MGELGSHRVPTAEYRMEQKAPSQFRIVTQDTILRKRRISAGRPAAVNCAWNSIVAPCCILRYCAVKSLTGLSDCMIDRDCQRGTPAGCPGTDCHRPRRRYVEEQGCGTDAPPSCGPPGTSGRAGSPRAGRRGSGTTPADHA